MSFITVIIATDYRLDYEYNNKFYYKWIQRTLINRKQLEGLDFADDIALLAHTGNQMQDELNT